jgi:hypothetical protein
LAIRERERLEEPHQIKLLPLCFIGLVAAKTKKILISRVEFSEFVRRKN